MTISVSITESQVIAAIRSFLLTFLPTGTEVIRGEVNRVPEPATPNFVIMWPLRRTRLETNVDSYSDIAFIGAISGSTLTVTTPEIGTIAIGNSLFGVNVAPNTTITAGSGMTWTVAPPQTVASSLMACGTKTVLQATEITMQLDVHGPVSGDNAQLISTLFRDQYSISQFISSGYDVTPLYATDPVQSPFINGEQQYEYRWIVELAVQANIIVTVPQQFADALDLTLVEVETLPLS
jgi:hypothetical protein